MKNKALGVFLVILAIPLVIISLLLISNWGMAHADFYKNILNQSKTYSNWSDVLENTAPEDKNILLETLKNTDEAWLRTNTEKNLNMVFAYLEGKAETLDFSIPTANLKTNLIKDGYISEEAQKAIPDNISVQNYADFLKDLKIISLQQANAFGTTVPAEFFNQFDQSVVAAEMFKDNFNKQAATAKRAYQIAIFAGYAIFALTIFFLLCIAIAARHYPPSIFRWVGEALLIPSTILTIAALLIQKLINDYFQASYIKLPETLQVAFTPLVNTSLATVFGNIAKISLYATLLGLFLILMSYLWPKIAARDIHA
jgi:hypothetical protein